MYIKEITNKEELTRYIEKNTEKLFRYFIKYLKSADWLRAIILEQIGASEVEALNFNIEYEEQKEDIINFLKHGTVQVFLENGISQELGLDVSKISFNKEFHVNKNLKTIFLQSNLARFNVTVRQEVNLTIK